MEPNKPKAGAFDFFVYLGVLASLYAGIGFLLNLLFNIINYAYPKVGDYYGYAPSLSLPVSAIIVLTPLFLFLSSLISKSQERDSSKKDIWIRKWFIYLTLFLTGALVIGDLITLVYYFLDGRELTTGFLLKVLSIFIVSSVVFGYYISNLRDKITNKKIWRIGTIVGVIAVIALAFNIIGSPRTQRLARYDEQKVYDLQAIQSQIIQYWQSKEKLPQGLNDLKDPLSNYVSIPSDKQTGRAYEYSQKSANSFELCAEFNLSLQKGDKPRISNAMYYVGMENENWQHESGRYCFERTVDPDRYPPFNKR